VQRGTGQGDGQRPERHLDAVPAAPVPRGRVGLDVPIETKLHAPNPRAEWMERPELTGYLARTSVKLVLVDAPAGFGKTTVVAQWRSSALESRPFAWVSLDRSDDDPSQLWWYVVTALQRACPQLGVAAILAELQVQDPDVTGTVLPLLANELAALPAPLVLVLDDYHVIKERSCHEQIEFLLQHLPPPAQIVLITRADPPLPLARLRAAGEMVEIRARELRFAPAEAAALVQAAADVRLGEPDLADLMERTEGWPAGVYLAALSLRGHPSPHDFVREFTGDNRFIVDFLADEVLSRQPGEIRQFLERTSILARFCAPLCDAVTGSADAAKIIEALERENLFLVPLDDNRQWYRYHHLFAQLLRSQLALTDPGRVRSLHQRASAWHQQSGSTEEAISHALAADDTAGAVDMIARYWFSYVDGGRTATVRGWMRSLGDDRIAAHPLAAHCAAWAAALTGDRETVRRWLPLVETGRGEGPLPDGMQSLRSSAALLRGVFGFDGLRVMHESAVAAADLESDQASPWYAAARAALGLSLYLSGDPAAAAVPLEDAVQSESSIPVIRMFALSAMALVAVELGRLSKAQDLAQAATVLATRSGFSAVPQSGLAHIAMGAVHAARGEFAAARSELEPVLESRRRLFGISPWPTLELLLLLARVLLDVGDRAGAADLAAEAQDVLIALPGEAGAPQARLAALDRRIAGRSRVVSLAEPLTEREVAVLRLLGGSLSLREIGQELYVSANTVKTHTQAIYRKLGVSTRRDAVEQGRLLGI
jgi:LuxR family transcriptional regulator, maltose regulon positive regulatory protein